MENGCEGASWKIVDRASAILTRLFVQARAACSHLALLPSTSTQRHAYKGRSHGEASYLCLLGLSQSAAYRIQVERTSGCKQQTAAHQPATRAPRRSSIAGSHAYEHSIRQSCSSVMCSCGVLLVGDSGGCWCASSEAGPASSRPGRALHSTATMRSR